MKLSFYNILLFIMLIALAPIGYIASKYFFKKGCRVGSKMFIEFATSRRMGVNQERDLAIICDEVYRKQK